MKKLLLKGMIGVFATVEKGEGEGGESVLGMHVGVL